MSTYRTRWCEYIQRHPDVLRLLSARGDVALVEGMVGSEARIAEFLSKLNDPPKDSRLLYGLMYLLRPALGEFVLGPLTRLVKSAARATKKTTAIARTGIRGPVLWHRTLIGRVTGQLDPGSFQIRLNERHQDIPENQLLKLFLQSLIRLAAKLSNDISSGAASKQLTTLQDRATQLLRTNWLQEITVRQGVTALMSRRAARSKDNRYSQILRFQTEYDAVFSRPKWQFILLLIGRGWLEPVSDDDVLELHTLIQLMDVLRVGMGFDLQRLGLIARNRREVAMLSRSSDSAGVQVYFDQSPVTIFGIASSYRELTVEYENIVAQPRRPDLAIRFTCGDRERRVLIECKDTIDDDYRRDSIYKAMGYLQDFSALWSASKDQKPKVIVVFPGDIKRKLTTGNEILLVGADAPSELRTSLQSAFTT